MVALSSIAILGIALFFAIIGVAYDNERIRKNNQNKSKNKRKRKNY